MIPELLQMYETFVCSCHCHHHTCLLRLSRHHPHEVDDFNASAPTTRTLLRLPVRDYALIIDTCGPQHFEDSPEPHSRPLTKDPAHMVRETLEGGRYSAQRPGSRALTQRIADSPGALKRLAKSNEPVIPAKCHVLSNKYMNDWFRCPGIDGLDPNDVLACF